MNWNQFSEAAPELAAAGEKLFDQSGVVLVGTVRRDGSPRISPVESLIADGELYLGMMWQSYKALDLLRDPRCVIHNTISDRMATDGEFKLHGRARDVQDEDERRRYCEALQKKIGWSPSGMNFHLFAVDIHTAGLFIAAGSEARQLKRWRAGEKVQTFRQGIDARLVPVD